MSTEITASHYGRVRLTAGVGDLPAGLMGDVVTVTLTNTDGQYPEGRTIPRADLLAAVATECEVIVIDRADLPEVTADGCSRLEAYNTHEGVNFGPPTVIERGRVVAGALRGQALARLALAEHLDAHPPVDEAQVEALAAVMRKAVSDGAKWVDCNALARVLVAEGWSK